MPYQVTTVIFDKTGTLTKGTPCVTEVAMFVDEDVCPEDFFLAVVASAESNSDHPLAYAVINYAKEVSWLYGRGGSAIFTAGRHYILAGSNS